MKQYKSTENKQSTFGFEKVSMQDKLKKVSEVFYSVASKYDLMNDLMSFGMHRFWKEFSIEQCNIQPEQVILDVATGTGDLAKKIAKRLRGTGALHLCDLQQEMIKIGRDNMINDGFVSNVHYSIGDAEKLPYKDNMFDCLTIGFGLRNVANIDNALSEFYRVLKPRGKLMILEFSKINPNLKDLYDWYSFNVIPWLGKLIVNDQKSYQYLVESIRTHPDQVNLMNKIIDADFSICAYENLSFGIVSMHICYK